MRCTECGFENAAGVVICQNCDHILDASFLGDDALGGAPPLDDEALSGPPTMASETTGTFLTAQTSNGLRLLEPEPFPNAEASVLFDRDAVLAVAEGVDVASLGLSPFESHVIAFINGERPVARVRTLAGVGTEDLRICLGMLADRGLLVRVATARATVDENEKTGEISLEGVSPELVGFEGEPRTDAVLLPEDLLESDDADVMPEITPLPVAPRPSVVDLASVALDFVDDESPMTLEPGASPFAAPTSGPLARPSAPPPRAAPTPAPAARANPPRMPPPPSSSGAPPLPGMAPSTSRGVPPMPGTAPARASAAPPLPGMNAPVRPAGPAPSTTPGVRPALRPPGAVVERVASSALPPTPSMEGAPLPTSGPVAVPRRAPTENQLKARQAYELAIKDLRDNKPARALTYARAARELDPENDLYKELLDNWGKQRAGVAPVVGTKR